MDRKIERVVQFSIPYCYFVRFQNLTFSLKSASKREIWGNLRVKKEFKSPIIKHF